MTWIRLIKSVSCLSTIILGLILSSCSPIQKSSIPNLPVFYEVFFDSAEGRALLPPGGIITLTTAKLEAQRLGFAGLIVVHSLDQEGGFHAFDIACPVEAQRNVRLQISDTYEAVCPMCKSHYTLLHSSGAPVSGPSREALLRYHVIPIPGGVRVVN